MPTQLMESGGDWDLFHLLYTRLGPVGWETHIPAFLMPHTLVHSQTNRGAPASHSLGVVVRWPGPSD